jgi:hypothetical protein
VLVLRRLRRELASAQRQGHAHGRQRREGVIGATTMRSDGKAQVTYNGHPLYTFSGDERNGEGVNAFGGNWYAVDPSGNQIVTSTSTGY